MRYTEYEITEQEKEFIFECAQKYVFESDLDLISDLYACLCEGVEEVMLSRQDVLYSHGVVGDWTRLHDFVNTLFFQYIYRAYSEEDGLDRLLSYMRFNNPLVHEKEDQEASLADKMDEFLQVVQFFGGDEEGEEAEDATDDANGFLSKDGGKEGEEDGDVAEQPQSLLAGVDKSPPTFSGEYAQRADAIRRFVANLSAQDWLKLHLVDNFENYINDAAHTKEREEVETPEDTIKIRTIRDFKDVGKILKSDMAKFDSTDDMVVAINRNDVNIIQDETPIQKKQLLYFVIDNSGSMAYGRMFVKTDTFETTASCGTVASCLAFAFLRKIKEEGGIFFLRFFATYPGELIYAQTPEDFRHTSRMLAMADYNGGGTDIMSALERAYKDIEEAEAYTPLEKASVCLITDGESDCRALTEQRWQDRIAKYGLHVAHITGGDSQPYYYGSEIKDCATTHRMIDSIKKDNLGNLIKEFSE